MPFWSIYLSEIGYGAQAIGLAVASIVGIRLIGPSFWAWLGDSSGRHLSLVRWCCFGAMMSFLGLMWAPENSLWTIIGLCVVTSFFWSGALPQFEALTLRFLQGRVERYSLIRLWGSIGFICTVIGFGVLFDSISILWLPTLVLAVFAMVWISSLLVKGGHLRWRTEPGHPNSVLRHLGDGGVALFFFACMMMQLSHGAYYGFYSIYLRDHGYSNTEIGVLWALGVTAEIALFAFLPQIMRRTRLADLLLISLLLAALRWAAIAASDGQLWILLPAQFLHAATFGSFHAAGIELVRRLFHGGSESGGQAFYIAISFGLGGACGASLAGWLWGFGGGLTAFSVAALAAVVGWALMWGGLRHWRNEDPERYHSLSGPV